MKRAICAIILLSLVTCGLGCNNQPTTSTSSSTTSKTTLASSNTTSSSTATTTLTTSKTITTSMNQGIVVPIDEYETFEIKADDIRFTYFHPPLFKFEYPLIYKLIDENQMDFHQFGENFLQVYFIVQNKGIPKAGLYLTVQTPEKYPYFKNAKELLDWELSNYFQTSTVVTGNMIVFGISGYYLESQGDVKNDPNYPEYSVTTRQCIFDYDGLIWQIILNWCYRGEEPPIIKDYFDHLIETFEILN
jgi:hypothetical protein